jgi:hypothetical protein
MANLAPKFFIDSTQETQSEVEIPRFQTHIPQKENLSSQLEFHFLSLITFGCRDMFKQQWQITICINLRLAWEDPKRVDNQRKQASDVKDNWRKILQ